MRFLYSGDLFRVEALPDQTLRLVQAEKIVGQAPRGPLPEGSQAVFRVFKERGREQVILRHPGDEDWQRSLPTALHNLKSNHVIIIAEIVEADEEVATPKGFHGGGSGGC